MLQNRKHFPAVFLAVLCTLLTTRSAEGASTVIGVKDAISHPTPAPGVTAVGYLTLSNHSKKADRLLRAESPAAKAVEIHEMSMDGGVMRMRALRRGVALPAGKSLRLAAGGLHLMLFEPDHALVAGELVPLTLIFQRAGRINLLLKVEPRGD